jgi:hypothetical protein
VLSESKKKKQSKVKGERQHKVGTEQLSYESEIEENRKKIQEGIQQLQEHEGHLQKQFSVSQTIIE